MATSLNRSFRSRDNPLTLEGGARLRPTHDALLRIWPEAAALVKEIGPLIQARHALAPLAQAWAEALPGDKRQLLKFSCAAASERAAT